MTFVQELLRRDLADALKVDVLGDTLKITRNDSTVPWQDLLTMTASPASIPPITVSYSLVDRVLKRTSGTLEDPLIALDDFESVIQDSDVRVRVELVTGQRRRSLIWNFWCPAL